MGNQATAERKPALQRIQECRQELQAGITPDSVARAKRVIEDIEEQLRDGKLTLRGDKDTVLSFLMATKLDISGAERDLREKAEAAEKQKAEEERRRVREAKIDRNLERFTKDLSEQIEACRQRIEKNEDTIGRLSSIPKDSRSISQESELVTRTQNMQKAIAKRDELEAELAILQSSDGEAKWRANEGKALDELEEQTKQRAAQKAEAERQAEAELKQLMESADRVGLEPVYDAGVYGEAVIKLLRAGVAAGKRIPDERDLTSVALAVHKVAGSGGFSSADSTSNGLINRIRAESFSVVQRAHGLGYNVDDADVRAAMAALSRSVAMAQDSDSGGRDEKKEHLARGMSYFSDSKIRDQVDLSWEDDPDPRKKLEKLRDAESAIGLQLTNLRDERTRKLLEDRLKLVQAEIKKLTKT